VGLAWPLPGALALGAEVPHLLRCPKDRLSCQVFRSLSRYTLPFRPFRWTTRPKSPPQAGFFYSCGTVLSCSLSNRHQVFSRARRCFYSLPLRQPSFTLFARAVFSHFFLRPRPPLRLGGFSAGDYDFPDFWVRPIRAYDDLYPRLPFRGRFLWPNDVLRSESTPTYAPFRARFLFPFPFLSAWKQSRVARGVIRFSRCLFPRSEKITSGRFSRAFLLSLAASHSGQSTLPPFF